LPTIEGDADWGNLILGTGEIAHGPVKHFNRLDSQTTLLIDKYGVGIGSISIYYRESDTVFTQDAVLPAWNLYSGPVRLSAEFRQVKLTGN